MVYGLADLCTFWRSLETTVGGFETVNVKHFNATKTATAKSTKTALN